MGIDGLLKNLKKCMREKNLEEYRGKRAAVDTYAWLHKIIKGPSGKEIITGKHQRKYVNDCLRRVEKISKVGIDLILVFDGGALPRKLKEQETRKKRRQQNFEKGKDLISKGCTEQGLKSMIDSIDVSPDVAYKLIEQLKNRGIKFIIAPYEADAQLAYLSRQGIVDVIITEDSDLLAFGAKKILYKLDFSTLNGQQICLQSIKHQPETGFNWFTHNMFLSTCIMAGCDYLDQIKGVGMKLAQKVISRNHTVKKALSQLSQTKNIPESYEENFMKAMLTFRFQRVYCPIRKQCVSVNNMQPRKWREIDLTVIEKCQTWGQQVLDAQILEFALRLSVDQNHPDWQFLGKKLSNQMARKIAEGDINPITFEDYDENCLDKLRYDNQMLNLTFMSKKSSTISIKQSATTSILKYCRQVEKKNPLQSKGLKARSLSNQEYKIYHKQEKVNMSYFPIAQIRRNELKKKSLKFNDDSDEQEVDKQEPSVNQVNQAEQSIQLIISSDQSPIGISSGQAKSQISYKSGAITQIDFRNRLQQISQTMFGHIFSAQFLASPFSQ